MTGLVEGAVYRIASTPTHVLDGTAVELRGLLVDDEVVVTHAALDADGNIRARDFNGWHWVLHPGCLFASPEPGPEPADPGTQTDLATAATLRSLADRRRQGQTAADVLTADKLLALAEHLERGIAVTPEAPEPTQEQRPSEARADVVRLLREAADAAELPDVAVLAQQAAHAAPARAQDIEDALRTELTRRRLGELADRIERATWEALGVQVHVETAVVGDEDGWAIHEPEALNVRAPWGSPVAEEIRQLLSRHAKGDR